MKMLKLAFCLALTAALVSPAKAQTPQAGDLIFGLNTPCMDLDMNPDTCDPMIGEFSDTLELVRDLQGTPAPVAGFPLSMTTTQFIQSVEFDNLNGMSHNANGNILGLNFGPDEIVGGAIYSFATAGSNNVGQLIGMPSTGLGGSVLTTRLAGLSVAPDNSKIAMSGFNTGSILIYDYTPGDTMGGGAALSNARESGAATLSIGTTSGTAWIDNNTIVAMDPAGTLVSVNATTGASSFLTSVAGFPIGSRNAALEYNADISPFLFAAISNFDGATTNTMYVFDPTNNYAVVNTVDLSMAANTSRELSFDANGNLYMSQFGSEVGVINGAAANAATITAADFTPIYTSEVFASFSGIDVAVSGAATMVDGDFNNDGAWDCTDINLLTAAVASGMNDPAFDMNDDGVVDGISEPADVDNDLVAWLERAGMEDTQGVTGGNPFIVGDANLDGTNDGQDFIQWNNGKFTNNTDWCGNDNVDMIGGNFNGDNAIDGLDFILWNAFKFTSSSDLASVPEPATAWLVLVGLAAAATLRRRRG